MELTRHGIAYDLSTSPYKIRLKQCELRFSSEKNVERFLKKEKSERDRINASLSKRFGMQFNLDYIAFIDLYRHIENRGFYIILRNGEVATCLEQIKLDGLKVSKKS